MKKIIFALIIFSVLTVFSACETAKSNNRSLNNQTTVNDILQSGIAQEDSTDDNIADEEKTAAQKSSSDEKIDVDLTQLSSTMVYSEVYNMMSMPENYIGKTVKMSGIFSSVHDDTTGKDYYACIIKDATACCAQGIEFILTDESGYPSDGEDITVVGVFDTYNEGQFIYSTLRDASIV